MDGAGQDERSLEELDASDLFSKRQRTTTRSRRRKRSTAEFNGRVVSMPEYFRLMKLQRSAQQLDQGMAT